MVGSQSIKLETSVDEIDIHDLKQESTKPNTSASNRHASKPLLKLYWLKKSEDPSSQPARYRRTEKNLMEKEVIPTDSWCYFQVELE